MADVSFTVQAIDNASKELNKVNQSLGGMAKSLLGPIAGYASLAGAVGLATKMVKQSIDAYAESETVMVRLNATLKSTGRAADISSDQIAKMAGELSKLTGMDDESIIAGYNALMKYESIPTGNMEKIIKIAADMAAATGGDVASNAEMLGRVLETGLIPRTWGFSKALKEQIQTQIKAGDTATAMTAIMDELNKRFGGQAAAQLDTYAGRTQQLAVAWENYLEAVGKSPATFAGAIKGFAAVQLSAATTELELKSALYEAGLDIKDFYDTVGQGKAQKSIFNMAAALEALRFRTEPAAQAIEILRYKQRDATAAMEDGVDAIDMYSESIMNAAIGGKLDEMSASMATLRQEEDSLTKQLEDTKPWETSKVEDLTSALEDNRAKQAELSGAISEASQQLIFQQASAGLTGQALFNLANAMGVLDDNSYALATAIATEKQKLDDGQISAYAYQKAVRDIYDRYNELIALAASGPITVDVLTNWQNGGGGGGGGGGNQNNEEYTALGGPGAWKRGKWTIVGERGWEAISPWGYVYSHKQSVKMFQDKQIQAPRHFQTGGQLTATGGGSTVNLNIGTLIADNSGLAELERRLRHVRVLEDGRRL